MNKLFSNPEVLRGVQVLVVDHDRDNRGLYAFLLEEQGAEVAASGSIQDALDLLDEYVPNLLICEIRFPGESVDPLIQRVKSLGFSRGQPIPVLVTSTCPLLGLAQQLVTKIEAYLLKPIDIDGFIEKVWNLTRISSATHPPSLQNWVTKQDMGKLSRCVAGVN